MESTHATAETHEMSGSSGQTPTPDQGFRGMSGWRVEPEGHKYSDHVRDLPIHDSVLV
jgi:hypothetical protein